MVGSIGEYKRGENRVGGFYQNTICTDKISNKKELTLAHTKHSQYYVSVNGDWMFVPQLPRAN